MTISVGFQCVDGVVIAADRQITKEGGLKYQQDKILYGGTVRSNMILDFALSYAGSPDLAKMAIDRIGPAVLEVCGGNVFMPSLVREAVKESVLTRKETKGLEMLIAFGGPNITPFMFRTHQGRIVTASMEYIGVGDSSVIRYLSEIIKFPFNLSHGKILAAYLISVANRFIDGCGFGPDVGFIDNSGNFQRVGKEELDSFAPQFGDMERVLSETMGAL